MDDNEKDFKNGEPDLPTLQSDKPGDFSKKCLKTGRFSKKPEYFSGPLLPERYFKSGLLIRLFHSS